MERSRCRRSPPPPSDGEDEPRRPARPRDDDAASLVESLPRGVAADNGAGPSGGVDRGAVDLPKVREVGLYAHGAGRGGMQRLGGGAGVEADVRRRRARDGPVSQPPRWVLKWAAAAARSDGRVRLVASRTVLEYFTEEVKEGGRGLEEPSCCRLEIHRSARTSRDPRRTRRLPARDGRTSSRVFAGVAPRAPVDERQEPAARRRGRMIVGAPPGAPTARASLARPARVATSRHRGRPARRWRRRCRVCLLCEVRRVRGGGEAARRRRSRRAVAVTSRRSGASRCELINYRSP